MLLIKYNVYNVHDVGIKNQSHDVLAQEWFYDFRTRFGRYKAEHRHKSGASASRYANIRQNCGNTKHGTIRMASQKTLAFLFTSAIIRYMEA